MTHDMVDLIGFAAVGAGTAIWGMMAEHWWLTKVRGYARPHRR